MSKIILLGSMFFLFAALTGRCAPTNAPTEMELKQVAKDCVETEKLAPGMVIGLIDASGTKVVAYGKTKSGGSVEVNGDTVFEIGSITKVFTSLALADMVKHGEVELDDPISKYLPKSVKVPSRKGREITLVDLATHTSGLPRLPANLSLWHSPAHSDNPYADYTVEQMYAFLSDYTLPRDIGVKYEYSNLGGGLLGHVLALKAGTNYEALIEQRICRPLGMTNTQIRLSPELQARLAQGHNAAGKPVPNWDLPALAGAGALRSTANDLLKFAAANMGLTKSDLQPAMELEQTPRHKAGSPTMQIGLGWHIAKRYGRELTWHNGGTGGYRSFIGFDKAAQRGVVVLVNSAGDIDDLGFRLLKPNDEPVKKHTAIKLDTTVYDAYVGKYEFAPKAVITVHREGDRLFAQLTGQSALEVFPESETDFFLKAVDAQISFVKSDQGGVTALILHQMGIDQEAKKIK
jgi:D-alanyl-D-alanine-carboxypeptidase/D-alanyl-D-alanine-endopeptidase